MPRRDGNTGSISAQAQQDLLSEGIENFELPKTIVARIAKSAIPENAKLQKETILSLVKGSTVFINYLAATAHDVAVSKQHKSISASDVLKALEVMEFDDMVGTLQDELQVYRELAKTDKGPGRRASGTVIAGTSTGTNTGTSVNANASPSATKIKPGPTSPSKSKGKEKTDASISGDGDHEMDVENPDEDGGRAVEARRDDEEMDATSTINIPFGDENVEVQEEEEEEVEEEEDVAEEDEEAESMQDKMAIEESEILQDSRGLDDGVAAIET